MSEKFTYHQFIPLEHRPKEIASPYDKLVRKMTNTLLKQGFDMIDHNGTIVLDGNYHEPLYQGIGEVVKHSLGDLDLKSVEAARAAEMAPALLEAITSSPYISGINRNYLLDLVRWSVEAARDPDLISETTLRVGFGGSQDETLSMRLPAYLLPAVDIWRRLNAIRDQRVQKLEKVKTGYIFTQLVANRKGELTREEKKAIDNQARQIALNTEFDQETMAALRKRAGIFDMPKVEFFFVPNAATEINQMHKERVFAQTQQSIELIQAFVTHFFPDVAPYIQFRVDRPWSEHGPYTRLILDYCQNLLKIYDGPDLEKVISLVEELGNNHGQENGRNKAGTYAAIHPLVFQDLLRLPIFSSIIERDRKTLANITIGGRPERLFNRIRELISNTATPESLVEFAKQQLDEGKLTDNQYKRLVWWQKAYKNRQEGYGNKGLNEKWAFADLPLLTIPLITNIGEHPVYYLTEFDLPLTKEAVANLLEIGFTAKFEEMAQQVQVNGNFQKRHQFQSVTNDLQTLLRYFPEDQLLNFYQQFLPAKGSL